ncbi:SCO6880 family protein [Quadrisphaera sp. INWT6]|uniref:SCO6880 family protein n=1 Tax=Quadrisphaera sp. INWT6 TaxID=2596917 RepID=UPI001892701C|nr:SCO6880 family protein [Quadrisphaera sp. INWT6]
MAVVDDLEAGARSTPATRPERTYGNFRAPRSAGILGLGTVGTAVLLAGMVAVIVTTMFVGILPAAVLAMVVAAFLGTLLVRDRHGRSGLARVVARAGWAATRLQRAHLYRSGPLSHLPWGTHQLPGLLAASRLSEHTDSYGRRFALLAVPSTGDYTVVLAAEPDGASLVDSEQIDSWVAHWGAWLAALGNEPGLHGATVTVEAAPDTGIRLRREVETNLDPDAPELARAMLTEVMATYPAGSASVRAWVTLTFSAATRPGGPRRSAEQVGRDLAARLPGLSAGLHATGAGAARPVSAAELCEVMRTAYDPHAARLIEQARSAGVETDLRWSDVGPVAAQAGYDRYRHDGALSTTWSMTSPPRGEVFATVLAQLLAPHHDVDRKRVTLLYRPLDAAKAARVVEADKRAADFRLTSAARPSARAQSDQRAAEQAAREEARGAGLVNFALLVTATVLDTDASPASERLPQARAAVETLAATARVALRPVYGNQDTAFAAALPAGLVLPRHLRVPTEIREFL